MQYLVREYQPNTSSESADAKVFQSLPDAVKHIKKINNTDRLLVLEKEGTLDQLERFLTERLATVSLRVDFDAKRQWMITAFE